MKSAISIMILIVSSVFATEQIELGFRRTSGCPTGGSDAVVSWQAYDFELLQNGYSNYGAGSRWVCDDFEINGEGWIDEITIWMIWTGEQATQMNFIFSEDDAGDSDPNTNTDLWDEAAPCINTFTGDNNWGYDIYRVDCDLNNYFITEYGYHYYLETQADVVDNCFILVSPNFNGDYCWFNDGSGVYQRSDVVFGEDSDMFFILYGYIVSLESETWGSIKALF